MKIEGKGNLSRQQHWMIAYDISNHQQRRCVFKLLKDHGERVQFSVFECQLSKHQSQLLRAKLCEYMDETDSIRWYPLCQWCHDRLHWSGKGQAPQTSEFYLL